MVILSFLRRTFKLGKGRKYNPQPESSNHIRAPEKCKKFVRGVVLLLDGETITIDLPKKVLGAYLIEKIRERLNIVRHEAGYFGLQFHDHYSIKHWLDPSKQIKKQVPIGPPYTFNFRVRFYPTEPNLLKDELSKYQIFLQVKNDMESPFRLGNTNTTVAAEMAGLALQSELGDYIPEEHTPYLRGTLCA